jgi:hypothetical protein
MRAGKSRPARIRQRRKRCGRLSVRRLAFGVSYDSLQANLCSKVTINAWPPVGEGHDLPRQTLKRLNHLMERIRL